MEPKLLKAPPLMKVKPEHRDRLKPPYLMGVDGPLCDIEVSPTQQLRNLQLIAGLADEPLEGRALVDTGAIATCIDSDAAYNLGLQMVDTAYAQTAFQSPVLVSMYSAVVTFAGYAFELHNSPSANLKKVRSSIPNWSGHTSIWRPLLFRQRRQMEI